MIDWDLFTSVSPVVLLSLGGIWAYTTVIKVARAKRSIGDLPGEVHLYPANGLMSNFILPRIKWISAGKNHLVIDRFEQHKKYECDVYSQISLWPFRTDLVVSDAAAIKEIVGNRAKYPKPMEFYEVLSFFGRNIVASEGEQWKKYRKVTAPAFSERNSSLVWEVSTRTADGLVDMWNANGEKSIAVDHAVDITLPITLFVIGEAGFGHRMSWADTEIPKGHKMTFTSALRHVSSDVWVKLAVPDWAMGATERTKRTKLCFEELNLYMREMIRDRVTGEKAAERYDLFSSLLDSNDLDTNPESLDETELIGNIFIFLIAGHETSAHTLSLTLALLALHQHEQERLYQHIQSVCPGGRKMEYTDMPNLTYSLAVLYEALRLTPTVPHIPKWAAEDTTLPAIKANGDVINIPVPKGTYLVINTPGLHSNPHYWENPDEFMPERFLKDYDKDAFVPFSAGVRSCLGRKFAETQIVAALTTLVRSYKITVKEEPQFAHETQAQRQARLLSSSAGLTTTPHRIPLVFTKRD